MKPPQLLTVFETLVNAFACQQLSLMVGLELLNRLAVVCDVSRGTGAGSRYGFPTPDDVVRHHAADYRAIGFSRHKVDALLTLAQAIHDGRIAVEGLRATTTRRCAHACASCAAWGGRQPSMCFYGVSAVCMSSRVTTSGRKRASPDGSVGARRWITAV
jgi:hypothetical protein